MRSQDHWSTAVLELQELNREMSPTYKLVVLLSTAKAIYATVAMSYNWGPEKAKLNNVRPLGSLRSAAYAFGCLYCCEGHACRFLRAKF